MASPTQRSIRACVAACSLALGLGACNAVFGIEEGALDRSVGPFAADGGTTNGASGSNGGTSNGPNSSGFAGSLGPSAGVGGSSAVEPASGGAGGLGGSASAGASGMSSGPPPDPSAPFLIEGGLLSSPALDFLGYLFVYTAANGANVEGCPADGVATPDEPCLTEANGQICVRGQVDAVVAGPDGEYDFTERWGLGLAAGVDEQTPWDRVMGRVLGVSFVVEGAALPASLRFGVRGPPVVGNADPAYCENLNLDGDQAFSLVFDALLFECWNPLPDMPLAPALPITGLHWEVLSLQDEAQIFDFCLRDITPILAPDP